MTDPKDSPRGGVATSVTGSGHTVHVGHKDDEPSITGATMSAATVAQLLQDSERRSQQQIERMEHQIQLLTALLTQTKGTTTEAEEASTAADTLPIPTSAIKPRRSATARKVTYPHAAERSPATPPSAISELRDDEDAESARAERAASKAYKLGLKDILSMTRGFVEPFYADSVKDKGTSVIDFVEKVESAMSDVIEDQPEYRLTVVRMFLRDGALRWINDKMKQLKDKGQQSVDWEKDVRKAFIDAHVGTDTVELWLAKLGSLRLGKGNTKTPIELDSQFDTIARHVHPTSTAGDKATDILLTSQYRDIIAASNLTMYSNIVRTQPHSNLREWKTAVATQWNAEAQIRARLEQRDRFVPYAQPPRGGGGWKGRGGRGGGTSGASQTLTSAAAMNADDGAGREGEEHPADDAESQQLSAAGGGQRGGRGDTRTRPEWTEEQVKRYRDKLCFSCGAPYDKDKGCSKSCRNKAPKV